MPSNWTRNQKLAVIGIILVLLMITCVALIPAPESEERTVPTATPTIDRETAERARDVLQEECPEIMEAYNAARDMGLTHEEAIETMAAFSFELVEETNEAAVVETIRLFVERICQW